MKDLSLKTRMALAVSLLFIASSAAMTCFTLSFFEKRFTDSIAGHQFSLVSSLALSIDTKLAMAQTALVGASAKITGTIAADAGKAASYLDSRPTLQSIFDSGIYLFTPGGALIAESSYVPPHTSAELAHFSEFCRKTAAKKAPSSFNRYVPGHPAIFMATPVVDDQGRMYAILGGRINPYGRNFLEEMSGIRIGKSGYLYICDKERNVIVHPDKSRILERVAEGRNELLDRAVAGFEGSGLTVSTKGVPLISSFKRLAANDWIIAADLPLAEAYAPVKLARHFYIITTIVGTAGILLLAWLLMKRLTAPLQDIARQVAALPGKPPAQRLLLIDRRDEIGILAKAFNSMVAALEKQQEALRESEANFRTLAETASDGMFVTRSDGSLVYANGRIAEMTGYPVHELCLMNFSELADHDCCSGILTSLSRGDGEDAPRQLETVIVRKDGQSVPMEATTSTTIWQGGPAGLVIMRDIRERKMADAALQAAMTRTENEKARSEAIIAAIGESLGILDKEFRVIYQNQLHRDLFGEHKGKHCYSSFENKEAVCESCPVAMTFRDGKIHTVERLYHQGGRKGILEITASPLRDASGAIIAGIEIVRDVTERNVAETKLRQSEKHLNAAQEAAHVGSWEIDLASSEITWSKQMYQITGWDPGLPPPTQEEFFRIIHPDDREALAQRLRGAIADGRPFQLDARRIAADGSIRCMAGTGKPIFDETGKIVKLFGTVLDITERTQAQFRLKESEARFRAIFEGARDAILIADIETGIVLDANLQAQRLLGLPRLEIIGIHQSQLHPRESAERARDAFQQNIKAGGSTTNDLDILNSANKRIPVEISGSVVELADGRKIVIGIFRDIADRYLAESEIRNLNRNLRQRAAELTAANRDLEAFGYSLSHDLKTPLSSISFAGQALSELYAAELDETARVCIDSICRGSRRMGEMIDSMLLISRISSCNLVREEVNLSEYAREISLTLQVEEADREVTWSILPAVMAPGDPRLLKSVMENLLGNAWKYTRMTPMARIEFGLQTIDGEKACYVRDNGAGFDMADAERLFLPFQRLHQNGDFEGNGIGLATVRRIIMKHGGRVWAKGQAGRGATFYFVLP